MTDSIAACGGNMRRMTQPTRIVDYAPCWRADFARLNIEWLERWFVVEPVDRTVLSDPETHILAGGAIACRGCR